MTATDQFRSAVQAGRAEGLSWLAAIRESVAARTTPAGRLPLDTDGGVQFATGGLTYSEPLRLRQAIERRTSAPTRKNGPFSPTGYSCAVGSATAGETAPTHA